MSTFSWVDLKEESLLVLGGIERVGKLLKANDVLGAQKAYTLLLTCLANALHVCRSLLGEVLIPKKTPSSDEETIRSLMSSFIFGADHSIRVISGHLPSDDAFYQWRKTLDELVILSKKMAKDLVQSN